MSKGVLSAFNIETVRNAKQMEELEGIRMGGGDGLGVSDRVKRHGADRACQVFIASSSALRKIRELRFRSGRQKRATEAWK